jgi:hypothetical protein
MKRLFTLIAILGLVGAMMYPSLPVSQPAVSAQGCEQRTDEGITNDTLTTATISLPSSGCVDYNGMVEATADIANAGPFFAFGDATEKIFNIQVDAPTVVTIDVLAANPAADLDAFLVRPPADAPDFAVETDIQDAVLGFGAGFDEQIRANVLLPGVLYFLAVSNFEDLTSSPPTISPATNYTVRFTIGGNPDIHLDKGLFDFTLGRFTSGNGALEVNRFSLGEALGLSGSVPVEIVGIVYNMWSPERFGLNRPSPLGDHFNFVVFTAPGGTLAPPDNPTLLTNQQITITGLDTLTQADLASSLTVMSDQETFAGMFLDRRDPSDPNNLNRALIVSWRHQNEFTADRTYLATTTTPGDNPPLTGWRIEEFSSGGITSRGPLRFRLVVRVPGSNSTVVIGPGDGDVNKVPKTALIAH